MKTGLFAVILLASIAGLTARTQSQPDPIPRDPVRMIRLLAAGMDATEKIRAQREIESIPGVLSLEFDRHNSEVTIRLDIERTNFRELDSSLRHLGFIPWYH